MKDANIEQQTRDWLNNAVVGLNLCPFAKKVVDDDRLTIVVSHADNEDALVAELDAALLSLDDQGPDTILIVIPDMLGDFWAFNDFLDISDALLEARALTGTIQIATFHPDYQFADAPPDANSHYTNRSPYPTLHLLREADVESALASHPDPSNIPARNIEKLEAMSTKEIRAIFDA
ncbi:MAG: DUF1415 domain-containing protein [Woeseiaceae bacterium]